MNWRRWFEEFPSPLEECIPLLMECRQSIDECRRSIVECTRLIDARADLIKEGRRPRPALPMAPPGDCPAASPGVLGRRNQRTP